MTDTMRSESDSFGPIDVPADAYWGAQTQRSIENFPFGPREQMPVEIVHALGFVKQAAARVNAVEGGLDAELGEAIQQAAGEVAKGDPLQTARLAGILAAKRTSDLIPLCHPLPLTHVDVDIRPFAAGYRVRGRATTVGRTGVEMEALVAVSAACLTIYDMLKAVDRAMVIGPVQLLAKRGGRSGEYRRAGRKKIDQG